ncbi:Xylose isomerase-like TIM barrel [Sphingobacterium spiritivorum]|uniref:Xylose isomerase-like TIM barrel n=2 Tax=Sphingobacterium spiritivorum TaxID=258 RepID=A0A380BBZ0_SPHSI|nr:Xylose isomerase-like TIM barrel [Sphingobacterium spiritivorum]
MNGSQIGTFERSTIPVADVKTTNMRNIKFLICALIALTTVSVHAQKKAAAYPEKKLNWKLGAQAYTFRLFTFAQALDKIDSCDLRYVEAFPGQDIGGGIEGKMDYNLSEEGKKAVKALLKKKNISLQAYGVVSGKNAAEWEKIFAFAKSMDIPVINCEPKEADLETVSQLCDKYDIKAAIHNHPDPSFYWNPDKILTLLKGKSARMGACADVGHWARSGLNPVESLKKLEERVFHVHFKDLNVFGDKKAHDVHWGTGIIGMKDIINELKRQKFSGMISAEYEYNWENNKEDVKESAANFRKQL